MKQNPNEKDVKSDVWNTLASPYLLFRLGSFVTTTAAQSNIELVDKSVLEVPQSLV